MQRIAVDRGEWAGHPMLAEQAALVIEPRHPMASLNGKTWDTLVNPDSEPPTSVGDDEEYEHVNSWWSDERCATISIYRNKATGRVQHIWRQDQGWPHRWRAFMDAMDPCQFLDGQAEVVAQQTLATKIKPHLFNMYMLMGAFLETSDRSGITYVLRKNAPTVALNVVNGSMQVLTTLCLHPIGYYQNTPIGVMVPTDDVIAHLLMIRGDEHKFWAKANHHPPHLATARI